MKSLFLKGCLVTAVACAVVAIIEILFDIEVPAPIWIAIGTGIGVGAFKKKPTDNP